MTADRPAQPGAPLPELVARRPRRFALRRVEDVHDFTGPGVVAYGVEWPDGRASYRWNSTLATTVSADSVADVVAIHGHDGRTELVWLDPCSFEAEQIVTGWFRALANALRAVGR